MFLDNYNLFYSLSHDPHVNLAFEFELLNSIKPGEVSLLLYRNEPSIIFGRFQNPWREIKFTKLPRDITLVRRHSGGGTVYHDLGNWNFCFIRHGKDIEEKINLTFIQAVLKKFNVPVIINERSDLVVEHDTLKKVSGSAFRRVKNATLHHGTLLVNANLSSLKGVLGKEKNLDIVGKGVASYPSPVINLNQINEKLTWDTFIHEIENIVSNEFICMDEDLIHKDSITYLEKMKSWDWKWGQGPDFSLKINSPADLKGQIDMTWSKGIIQYCHSNIVCKTPGLNEKVESFLTLLSVHKGSSICEDNELFKYLYKIFLSQHSR
jgi:lipoate-protein ligase A